MQNHLFEKEMLPQKCLKKNNVLKKNIWTKVKRIKLRGRVGTITHAHTAITAFWGSEN
jgi:hypothetical protein